MWERHLIATNIDPLSKVIKRTSLSLDSKDKDSGQAEAHCAEVAQDATCDSTRLATKAEKGYFRVKGVSGCESGGMGLSRPSSLLPVA